MAELRVRTIDESELDTVLAEDLEFEGKIEFDVPLLVKGRLSGEVRARADLFIAASAVLDADVVAARVSVKGIVRGDISAKERIELFSGASIEGNIRTPDLIVQSGSHFSGTCKMEPQGVSVDDPAEGVAVGGPDAGDTTRNETHAATESAGIHDSEATEDNDA